MTNEITMLGDTARKILNIEIPNNELIRRTNETINKLERFIDREEISKFNPMYYICYPAKASVYASKCQLKGCYQGLEVLSHEHRKEVRRTN